jgi:hypothetical protein
LREFVRFASNQGPRRALSKQVARQEVGMLRVVAGRAPHTISRPCADRQDAERWAARMIAHGLGPVAIDGVLVFSEGPADPQAEAGAADGPDGSS